MFLLSVSANERITMYIVVAAAAAFTRSDIIFYVNIEAGLLTHCYTSTLPAPPPHTYTHTNQWAHESDGAQEKKAEQIKAKILQ